MSGIAPLTSTIGYTQGILDTRAQITDLQRQLGTGFRSETYAGLGTDRTIALSMKNRVSKLESYQSSIQTVQIRLDIMQASASRFNEIIDTAKVELRTGNYDFASSNRTLTQQLAKSFLNESVSVLNQEVAGRYVFSGRTVDTRPVENTDIMLFGDGTRAGLDTLANERKLADAGADMRGRLTLGGTVDSITLAEDGDHPFGFKMVSLASSITGTLITQPNGTAPQNGAVQLTLQPQPGDRVEIFVALPDGTEERITLTARADLATYDPPGTGDFEIGPDIATTVANLQATMAEAVEGRAYTELQSASTLRASRDFFAADQENPPMRVDGPPFESATGMVAGTANNTVVWYRGENGALDARDTSIVRIDDNVSVPYGARAAEEAFHWGMAQMAAFAVESFDPNNAQDEDRYQTLQEKIGQSLYYQGGQQTVQSITASLVSVVSALGQTNDRHTQAIGFAESTLDNVLRTDNEQTAVQILALQTRLQATYETTAILSQLSLVNYLR
jgi:flagellar hook-associated protein 3 FlgL